MNKELYAYACPKLSKEQTSPFNVFCFIFGVTLFSSLVGFVNLTLGVIISALYLVLSLLTFLNKDVKSRYLMMISLGILDVSIVMISFSSIMYPMYPFIFWSLIWAFIFIVIYEIVVFIKIKKCYYTSPHHQNKIVKGVSFSTVLLSVFASRFLTRNPMFRDLLAMTIVILSSICLLGFVISIQKLIIYLIVKNKAQ